MSLNSSKILYAFLALVIGLTVGVVVAVIVGVVVTLQCFVRFPLQLYAICVDNEKTRRLTGAFGTQSKKDLRRQEERTAGEKMWERHIKRMDKKKQKYKDHDPV
jgi:hypothetical protein